MSKGAMAVAKVFAANNQTQQEAADEHGLSQSRIAKANTVTRGGTSYTMDTGAIGKAKAPLL